VSRARRIAAVLLVTYVLLVGCIVFWPGSDLNGRAIEWTTHAFARLVGPHRLSESAVEFAANVLLFIPLTFLGSMLKPGWWRWVLIAFGLTVGIEVLQMLVLPDRSATVRDVVANTIGGMLGACAGTAVARPSRGRRS
jgi:glycopeptide antibiotics resistance protein